MSLSSIRNYWKKASFEVNGTFVSKDRQFEKALKKGNSFRVEKLLEEGSVDPNSFVNKFENKQNPLKTVLSYASDNISGRTKCVDALIKAGADVNPGQESIRPIHDTIPYFPEALRLLVEAGADFDIPAEWECRTPIEAAEDYGCYKIVEYLKQKTAETQASSDIKYLGY